MRHLRYKHNENFTFTDPSTLVSALYHSPAGLDPRIRPSKSLRQSTREFMLQESCTPCLPCLASRRTGCNTSDPVPKRCNLLVAFASLGGRLFRRMWRASRLSILNLGSRCQCAWSAVNDWKAPAMDARGGRATAVLRKKWSQT